jgi:SAM-dependent methyltransferase
MSKEYNFKNAIEAWTSPPGNPRVQSTKSWATANAEDMAKIVERTMYERHLRPGDVQGGWVPYFGISELEHRDKTILDFGSGIGPEALLWAKNGNNVMLADISWSNILYARRALEACGVGDKVVDLIKVDGEAPYFTPNGFYDIFYSVGVLHHTPRIKEIIERALDYLAPKGELWLMLYSITRWGQEPLAPDEDIASCPNFEEFVRGQDPVGEYADYYTPERLDSHLGGLMRHLEIFYHELCGPANGYGLYKLRMKSI